MRKQLLIPFRGIYFLYAAITFVALMLLVIPLVMIGSFFGKIKGGNFIYRVCCVWGDVWLILVGIWHRNLYEAPHNRNNQYIFVANHISYFDAPVIVETIRQPIRVLGKVEMAKIPLFGFIYRNAIVTVDRSTTENRAKSVRILKSVLAKNISIFIFPEGTFNTTGQPLKEFFDGAFRIAIETQTPIKPVLFLDAHVRMDYRSIFSITPGRSRSVFLDEIPVNGYTLRQLPELKKKVHDIMEARLRHYRASWISEHPQPASSA